MFQPSQIRMLLAATLSGISITAAADNATILDTITVTASPLGQQVDLSPSRVNVIDGADKFERETSSLGRFLEEIPGVNSANTGAQAGTPVIRGLTGRRIQVMSNGIGQEYQQDAARHIPNLDPTLYSRIEVVRGPMSVLYGSGAIGGVINALSPSPFEQTENGISGEVKSRYASNNKERMGGVRLSARQDSFGLQVGGFITRADDYRSSKTTQFQESKKPGDPLFTGKIPYTDYRSKNAYLSAGHEGEYGDISLSWVHWHQEQNYLILQPQPQKLPSPKPVGQDLQNDNIALKGNFYLSDWVLKPTYNFQRNQRQALVGQTWRSLSSANANVDVIVYKNTFRLGAEHPEFNGWRGEWGLEYAKTRQNLKQGALTPDAERDQFAIYGFEEKRLGPVIFEAGLRFDHINQKAKRSLAYPNVDTKSRDYHVFTGSLGTAWLVNDEWTLRANIGRGFRAPSFSELYSDGVHGGIAAYQRGNTDLSQETSLNIEAGADWTNGIVDLSATVYQNRFSDYIYLANTNETHGPTGLPIYQYQQANARLRGVELGAQWQINQYWSLKASYDAVRGKFTATKDRLPLLPADSLTARVDYQLASLGSWEKPRIWGAVRHVFSQDAAGRYEPYSQFDNNSFGTASTDSYTLLSLGGSVNRKLSKDLYLKINLRIDNLLDEDYRDFLDTYKGYAMSQGRNAQLNMSIAF